MMDLILDSNTRAGIIEGTIEATINELEAGLKVTPNNELRADERSFFSFSSNLDPNSRNASLSELTGSMEKDKQIQELTLELESMKKKLKIAFENNIYNESMNIEEDDVTNSIFFK